MKETRFNTTLVKLENGASRVTLQCNKVSEKKV